MVFGIGVKGLGFRVYDLGFRVYGMRFGVWGFKVDILEGQGDGEKAPKAKMSKKRQNGTCSKGGPIKPK